MKPNFALDLSHDGISLLHRGKGGWTLVGHVALDDPDMGGRLTDLRRSAAMLESGGFTTKLIIPNSQILYTTLDAAGPDDIAREVQIRSALDGLTPYPVGDLVFDWRAEGEKARVAVLARETMDEAESFAVEYKFNPVSFVARPDRGDFSGEPFFGKTRAATRLLAPGARVEPDASPVPRNPRALELSSDSRVDPAQEAPAPAGQDTARSADAAAPAKPPAKPGPKPGRDESEAPRAGKDTGVRVATPALAPFPPTLDEDDDKPRATTRVVAPELADPGPLIPADHDEPQRPPEPGPKPEPRETVDKAAAPAAFQTRRSPGPGAEAPSGDRLRNMATRIAIPGGPVPGPDENDDVKPKSLDAPARLEPAAPAASPSPRLDPIKPKPGTADRRRTDMADALARPLPTPDQPFVRERKGSVLGAIGARLQGLSERAGSGLKGAADSARDRRTARRQAKDSAQAAAPAAPAAASDTPAAPPTTKTRSGFGFRRASTGRSDAGSDRKSEAEALTVFGARKVQETAGRPKYLGLILTLLLLLAMAIVAVWSTFAIDDEETGLFNPPTGDAIVSTPVDDSPAPGAETPQASPEPQAAPPVPEPPVATGEVLSPEAAEARYAATGIWQRAPEPLGVPETTRLEGIEVATLSPGGIERAPAPVPGDIPGQLREALLTTPVPPPPPGTSFDLDESGLVRPTAEGALSPTGILVYAGPPARVPPPRPGDLPEDPPPFALPDAPDTRPLPRPADLVTTPTPGTAPAPEPLPESAPEPGAPALDPAAPATDDNAALEPAETPDESLADAVLTAPRPEPRPEDIVVSTSSPSAAIDAAMEDVIEAALVDATELAVAVSRKPASRPANFAAIVDSAREAASDGSRVVAAAAPAPAAASAAPAIPTSASVATRATMKNALNLRDINLIGIYGTSNARRALVRMSNGRYVKVEVGDRLDGGRVTSITATELTYQKGSRALKLTVLPLG